jgi:hypothetical protein
MKIRTKNIRLNNPRMLVRLERIVVVEDRFGEDEGEFGGPDVEFGDGTIGEPNFAACGEWGCPLESGDADSRVLCVIVDELDEDDGDAGRPKEEDAPSILSIKNLGGEEETRLNAGFTVDPLELVVVLLVLLPDDRLDCGNKNDVADHV